MSNDTANKKELLIELDRRFDEALVRIDQGYSDTTGCSKWFYHDDGSEQIPHPGFVTIQIPGEVGGSFKILALRDRIETVRKRSRQIFNTTPKRKSQLLRASSPATTLKQFIADGEFSNALQFAQLTGQIDLYKSLRNTAEANGNFGE